MFRLRRSGAATLLIALGSFGLVTAVAAPAAADHCPPIDNPHPVPGQNTTYCHTPQPTPAPPTSAPTAAPTPAPTPAPTATAAPRPPATRTAAPAAPGTPAAPTGTPFDIEVPTEEPTATAEIVVDPIDDISGDLDVGDGEQAASASTWIFGFIVGFILGGLAGRMSWGLRRRRRQQIFG